jgi:predicted ATPase/transcriptional regulator with XRE-family HTH domain
VRQLSDRVISEETAPFAEVLRELRLAAGLSQQALAERARMSPGGVSVLERGIRRAPYRDTVALLAEGLGLSAADRARLEAAAARPAHVRRRGSPVIVSAENEPTPHNLPFGLTRLIGRHADVAEVVAFVREAPLVTIAGAGGVGKTRTALQVGFELLESAAAGVWFVDLAALSSTSKIDRAVVQTLGIEETSKPALEVLLASLARKALVLIFDNCEHLIAQVADVVGEIVRTCPKVRVVATSREPLKIRGERIYRLRPLPTPTLPEAQRVNASAALGYGAIALFSERAQAIDHLFAISDENAPTVAAICRRLDGLPLAIELAAARVGTLTLKTLLEKLDDRFAILTGGVRKTLSRQQTMRALIDWSYDLLTPPEQRLFEALSIFRGGCTLAIATGVCGDDDLAANDILDLLASLVDKSLLVVDLDGEEPRYVLPESSRDYAREKLIARGGSNVVACRHARAYTKLAEQLEDASYTAPVATWAIAIEAELENWRAALEWALDARGDVRLGLRLAGVLRPVWERIALGEGRSWVRKAFELLEGTTPPEIVAGIEHAEARIAQRFSESQVAMDAGERALARYRTLGDRRAIAEVQRIIGHSLLILGRSAEAEPILLEALDTARELGCRWLAAFLIQSIGLARSLAGDLAGSQGCYAEADRMFREVGDEGSAAICAGNLAEAEFHAGDSGKALQIARDALASYRKHDRIHIYALANMAAYLVALGRYDEARVRAVEALELARDQGHNVALNWAMQHLAAVAALRPDDVEPSRARHARAARLLGYVDVRFSALGAPRQYTEQQEYDRVLEALRETFGADEFQRLMADGTTMTEDRAVEEAISV